jgi:hypothetical protein
MPKERTQAVCDGLAAAMRRHRVPEQILTDNGKVFTGPFGHPPVEVLFDRICRENGVEHLLTAPRSPTTTGKIERFHRSLRAEFDTARVFASLAVAQGALDEWVGYYNTQRPHQGIGDATPESRFLPEGGDHATVVARVPVQRRPERPGETWVSRKVTTNGVVCVGWQLVSLGKHRAGSRIPGRRPGHRRAAAVLDRRRAAQDGGPGQRQADPQQARRRHQPAALISQLECQGSTEHDPSSINRRPTAPQTWFDLREHRWLRRQQSRTTL